MQDYNFVIQHIPGESNKSDALSRRPDYDQGTNDNDNVTVLPPHLFIQTMTLSCLFARATTLSAIDERVRAHQLRQPDQLAKWATTYCYETSIFISFLNYWQVTLIWSPYGDASLIRSFTYW